MNTCPVCQHDFAGDTHRLVPFRRKHFSCPICKTVLIKSRRFWGQEMVLIIAGLIACCFAASHFFFQSVIIKITGDLLICIQLILIYKYTRNPEFEVFTECEAK